MRKRSGKGPVLLWVPEAPGGWERLALLGVSHSQSWRLAKGALQRCSMAVTRPGSPRRCCKHQGDAAEGSVEIGRDGDHRLSWERSWKRDRTGTAGMPLPWRGPGGGYMSGWLWG